VGGGRWFRVELGGFWGCVWGGGCGAGGVGGGGGGGWVLGGCRRGGCWVFFGALAAWCVGLLTTGLGLGG